MMYITFEKIDMTYIILRLILFAILAVGLYGWFYWCKKTYQHWLLIILPVTTIIHCMIFVFAGTLSRLTFIDYSAFINTWSQILRIQEYITIGAAPLIMLMVRKYE